MGERLASNLDATVLRCETKGMKAKVRANKGLMGREEMDGRGLGTMLATR